MYYGVLSFRYVMRNKGKCIKSFLEMTLSRGHTTKVHPFFFVYTFPTRYINDKCFLFSNGGRLPTARTRRGNEQFFLYSFPILKIEIGSD